MRLFCSSSTRSSSGATRLLRERGVCSQEGRAAVTGSHVGGEAGLEDVPLEECSGGGGCFGRRSETGHTASKHFRRERAHTRGRSERERGRDMQEDWRGWAKCLAGRVARWCPEMAPTSTNSSRGSQRTPRPDQAPKATRDRALTLTRISTPEPGSYFVLVT